MKNIFLILFLFTILYCCSKEDNLGDLPPETQVGANTVGCLVNGKVLIPHDEGINPSVNCFYQFVDGEFFFTMSFADLRGTTNEGVTVQTARINLQEGQTYILSKNIIDDGDYSGGGGVYELSASNRYFTNMLNKGELTITRVDLSNSIISGTFWFDAINDEGQIVEIREGRFDWDY